MNNIDQKQRKVRNSDSDYKAEDEGSASDNSTWRKYKKTTFNFKQSKKQIIENSIRSLIPIGIQLKYQPKLKSNQYEELLNTPTAQQFSFNYKSLLAKVIQVTDGERLKVIVLFQGKPIKINLRMNGIMTPEMKRPQTKQFGNHIKKILKSIIEGKIVRVETGEYDKYGNIFSRIYAVTTSPVAPYQSHKEKGTQFCLNDYLIEHDMAKGLQNKGKSQFTKKSYDQFCEKYETKEWVVIEHYPLEMVKEKNNSGDYDEMAEQNDE